MCLSINKVPIALLVAASASLSHAHWPGQCDLLKHMPLQIFPMVGTDNELPMLYPPATEGNSSSPQFHLYALEEFAGGRGISILTTPERIEAFGNLAAIAPEPNEFWSTIYEEREIPGKGRGLIAKKTIHKGDIIFVNTPILILDDDLTDRHRWSRAAVGGLPIATQKLFWELCRPDDSDLVLGRIDVNVFDVEIGGNSFAALFPEIARMNHDCRPNADYYFDASTMKQTVVATTTIPAGSEISITYIDPHLGRDDRVESLDDTWGFPCSCSACTLSDRQSALSDGRLGLIEELRSLYVDDGWENVSPQIADTLVAVYEQERLHSYAGQAAWLAALTHCAHGNRWETIRYAHYAIELGNINEEAMVHELDGLGLEELEQLTLEPETEDCWMRARMQDITGSQTVIS